MESNAMQDEFDDEFSFLNSFELLNCEKDDKNYTLKIIRKKDAYLLKVVENGETVQKKVIKDLSLIKQQLEDIEEHSFLYWQDKKGTMHIRLDSEHHHTETIELVDYAKYSNDVVFRMIVNKVQSHSKKRKRVVNQKKASSYLVQKKNMVLASLATAGVGCFVAIFGLSSLDDLELVDPVVHVEILKEEDSFNDSLSVASVEMVIDQTMAFMDEIKNPTITSIPVATDYEQARLYSLQLKEEMAGENSEYVMALYDQPLLPLDLNVYMYQMALKYDVSYTALIAIAHVESDGNFNNHAVIGCSGDEGFMQINPANYPVLCSELGYTPEQIKEDDKANIECAAFLLRDICKRNAQRNNGVLNEDEMYREYNGGGNFKIIPVTLDYLEYAKRAIDKFYNVDHLIYVRNPEVEVKTC